MLKTQHLHAIAWLMINYCLASAQSVQAASRPIKPFRIGVIAMNRNLDQVKPLAESDPGGFVLQGSTVIGSYDATRIRAYNIDTRKNKWWFPTDGEITAPPLLVENSLFFATRSGQLTAVNATNGKSIWTTELDSYIDRPLTFSNGIIYAVTTGQVAYAVDGISGKRLWVHDAGFPDKITVRRAPAAIVQDGRLIMGLTSGDILALKIEDGKQVWKYNPFYQETRFTDFVGELIVHNGKLLITRYDGLIALVSVDQERQVIWQDVQSSASTSTFRAGRYYVGLTNGEIIAYDATSGRISWRTQLSTTPAFIVASETGLYVIGNSGRVSALDIATGGALWYDDLGSRIATAPIISGNKMFVATGLHNLYGYIIK
jgi:outer membrane protein assembly factor BamB